MVLTSLLNNKAERSARATQILGQSLTGSTTITLNGVPAASFAVVSDTCMTALARSCNRQGRGDHTGRRTDDQYELQDYHEALARAECAPVQIGEKSRLRSSP